MPDPVAHPPQAPAAAPADNSDTRAGFIYAASAYGLWGFMPLYMKVIDHISPVEIVAHRAFWSLPVAGAILIALGRTRDVRAALSNPRQLAVLALCAAVISLNWGIYVWAIAVERTVETALGYYINPLVSVALGAVFLGERFTRAQLVAILLAAAAVALLAMANGELPWVSLVLAFSFATYGYLRKTTAVGPTQGFLVETMILSVAALPMIIWFTANGGNFLTGSSDTLLLLGCGPITAIPLILYAFGAKGLRLSTIGLMQYIAPTMIFLIGVFVFREPFSGAQLIAFCMIWAALAIYSGSAIAGRRAARRDAA